MPSGEHPEPFSLGLTSSSGRLLAPHTGQGGREVLVQRDGPELQANMSG